jgi:methylmalonyl-CoA mutase C-terminal domain/subunit
VGSDFRVVPRLSDSCVFATQGSPPGRPQGESYRSHAPAWEHGCKRGDIVVEDERKLRVLISKTGLDGHDRGAKVVSHALSRANMEVVYLGLFQTPETIVKSAVQEGVDVIGLSVLSGEHMSFVSELKKLIKENGLEDLLFIVGGTIPRPEIRKLKEMGVDEVFEAGTPMNRIVEYIQNNAPPKRHS